MLRFSVDASNNAKKMFDQDVQMIMGAMPPFKDADAIKARIAALRTHRRINPDNYASYGANSPESALVMEVQKLQEHQCFEKDVQMIMGAMPPFKDADAIKARIAALRAEGRINPDNYASYGAGNPESMLVAEVQKLQEHNNPPRPRV